MLTKTMYNGVEIPMIGYGTYMMTDPAECRDRVYDALTAGYRLIDTADMYANHKPVGEGLHRAVSEGIVRREDVFLTTKIWFEDFEADACRRALEAAFRDLGEEYLDLVLLHWPYGNVYAAWRVLEEYYRAGRIRAIGVSNLEADRLIDLIRHNEVRPMLNQIETHLYCQRQEEKKWLDKYGVVHQAYRPLGKGKDAGMFAEPAVTACAEKYGKSPVQILLRFLLQSDVAVIPKSARAERIRENIDIFDFELTPEETAALRSLDRRAPLVGIAEDPVKTEEMLLQN